MNPRRRSQTLELLLAWSVLLACALTFSYDFLFRNVEFLHNDIVPTYFPFRKWYLDRILHGEFPLWNPYWGLGRIAEVWTTLPIDVLTPLELILPLEPQHFLLLQAVMVLGSAFFAIYRLTHRASIALFSSALFFMSPLTNYFFYYYVHGWAFIGFALGVCWSYQYAVTGASRLLLYLYLTTTLFALGSKPELTAHALVGLTFLFVGCVLAQKHDWRSAVSRVVRYFACLTAALLTNAWYFYVIWLSGRYSIRYSSPGDFSWPEFLHSLMRAFVVPENPGVVVLVVLLVAGGFWRYARGMSIWLFPVIVAACAAPLSEYVDHVGRFASRWQGLGALLALLTMWIDLRWRSDRARVFQTLVALELFTALWGQKAPGYLDEVKIMEGAGVLFRILVPYLALLGASRRKDRVLVLGCLASLSGALVMRTVGLPWYNYATGLLWLASRDTFIIEFVLTVMAAIGLVELIDRLIGRVPALSLSTSAAMTGRIAFALLGIIAVLPSWQNLHVQNPGVTTFHTPPFSAWAARMVHAWKTQMTFSDAAGGRVLSYSHSFNIVEGISDAREYQSLVSDRYARYSIFHRLGLEVWRARNIGGVTGTVPYWLLDLVRPVSVPEALPPVREYDFYYNYIIHAMPPLECGVLRLMGISYIEGVAGRNGPWGRRYLADNYSTINNSHHSDRNLPLGDDVIARIDACGFSKVRILDQEYWHVDGSLPRAVFLPKVPGLDRETLAKAVSASVDGQYIQVNKSVRVRWQPVALTRYRPESVSLAISSPEPGFVLLLDLYHPMWRALLGGRDATVFPGLYLFRAVELPPGTHVVDFVMQPIGLGVMLGLALMGPATASLVIWTGKRSGNPHVGEDARTFSTGAAEL